MTPEGRNWRDLYEFDTPVVSEKGDGVNHVMCVDLIQIHVSNSKKPEEVPELSAKANKLMHRFTEEEVKAKMDAAEANA